MFYYILLLMSIFFHFSVFAQTVGEDPKQKNTVSFTPLNVSVLPKNTFSIYRPRNRILNNMFEFDTYTSTQQSKFRVSLVGVNINTWLENPENFNVLRNLAHRFSVENLLDNLAAYNPELEFNDPDTVSKALYADIYGPYLKILANGKTLPRYFSAVSNTVSFTRNYHIYGVAARNFPYFGQPLEAADRDVNLGILPGQLEEYQVKLPDTDIFLVAMINISPNWLEEGWDIFQVNRQKVTVRIYAFNRDGRLIGGGGVPQSLFYNGQRFVVEQALNSRVWQPLISRRFYAWPSFKIINTPVPDTEKTPPSVVLPDNEVPRINRLQRYILKSVKNLQGLEQSIDIQLFDAGGKQIYKPVKLLKNTNKVFLAKREIVYKNRTAAGVQQQNSFLNFVPYALKAQNFDEDAVKTKKAQKEKQSKDSVKKSVLSRSYYPSNEGDKLKSIFNDALAMMIQPLVSYSNKLNITNMILPFEKEMDPAMYHKKRRKYYSIKLSSKDFVRNYKKKTHRLIDSMKREQKEQLFWVDEYKKMLAEKKLWNDDWEKSRKAWEDVFLKKGLIELQLAQMDRKEKLAELIPSLLDKFSAREREEWNSKYKDKEKALMLKMSKIDSKVDDWERRYQMAVDSEEYRDKKSLLKNEWAELSQESDKLFDYYIRQLPKDINMSIDDTASLGAEEREELKEIAKKYRIPEQAAAQIYATKKSPAKIYLLKQERKLNAKHKKALYLLYYEGFMLGLSSSWHVKTTLEDRMVRL